MGKVNETGVNQFCFYDNGENNFKDLSVKPDAAETSVETAGNPTAYQEKILFNNESYRQMSLNARFGRDEEISGIGGAGNVKADSTPEELLKNPRIRAMLDTIAYAEGTKGNNLIKLGYMTRAQVNTGPGIFGPKTEAALKRFQSDHNLQRDGIFGPKTFRAMRSAISNPANPPQTGGRVHEYRRWNVYSTGDGAARLADGYEDLQAHHGPKGQWTNYVSRNVRLDHDLLKRDIVLTRPGQSNFGQAVPSPLEGKVLFAGDESDGYGKKVVIKNERTGQIVMIAHLQSINVKRNQTVSYGQNLGGQGSTGISSGAHIHINGDPSVIRRWIADLADGKFDGVRTRFDIGRKP